MIYGPDTRIQVQDLAERHVHASDPPSYRRRQGTLDAHAIGTKGLQGALRQGRAEPVLRLLARVDPKPLDRSSSPVRLLDGCIHDPLPGGPYVDTDPISLNIGDDRPVRHTKGPVSLQHDTAFTSLPSRFLLHGSLPPRLFPGKRSSYSSRTPGTASADPGSCKTPMALSRRAIAILYEFSAS